MKSSLQSLLVIIFLFVTTQNFSQNIVVTDNITAQSLIQNTLINSSCATTSNFQVIGGNFNGQDSFGSFTDGGSTFPFATGIVLSTGKAVSASGPNTSLLSEGLTSWSGDTDLEQALSISNSINATVLEFDFVSLTNKISFDYIFSSEQYLLGATSGQCNFTDGFAFLLKEAGSGGSQYENLALVPGTSTPVKVNTVRGSGSVCPVANETYFGGFNSTVHPTNFNGQTVPMKAIATVTPGVLYHIKLVIADQGNNLYDSAIFLKGGSFKSEKNLGVSRLNSTLNPLCFLETITLNATESSAIGYKWYKDGIEIISAINNPTYQVSTAGTYSVEILINATCIITGSIVIEEAPVLNINDNEYVICETNSDGIATFDLNAIKSSLFTNLPSNYTITFVDASGTTILPLSYNNTVPFQETIYALIANVPNCYGGFNITLKVVDFNDFPDEEIEICNTTPTEIMAPTGYTSYSWNTNPIQITPNITTGIPGVYIVTITNSEGCTKTKKYTILNSEKAIITNIEVTDFEEQLTATISVSGNGNYEYSLDGINYQDNPVFLLNNSGEFTAFVNDKNGCGQVSQDFYALSYPKFFTPNGDGFNDFWIIKNIDSKSNYTFSIFDRFGKLMKQSFNTNLRWNGDLNGKNLPSGDYWFVLTLFNNKTVKGHFSLKR